MGEGEINRRNVPQWGVDQGVNAPRASLPGMEASYRGGLVTSTKSASVRCGSGSQRASRLLTRFGRRLSLPLIHF